MFKRRNYLLKYTTHLLRHTVKKCPQRIRTDRDVRGSMQKRDLLNANLVVKQLYTDVQLLNRLFQKAYRYLFFP